ncbi:MAG: protein-L-isoaspartate O-methyltransferase [marine bacterium B5-7]|nr:MAG: protein-L-isoaspartate O-methyltransferase [marine bacterium B5-7]
MDFKQARFNMIEQQIRTWEVLDQDVLDLLNEIHREEFVPESYQNLAFADTSIPIGHGQTTMAPKFEARILQSLDVEPNESVLEIGTGCGYFTALLASSAKHIKSVDIFPDFIDTAREKIAKTKLTNIELENCDAYSLLEKTELYNVIVFTASLPSMDERFLNLLNDNGRLFIIVGESPAMEARLYTKQNKTSWSYDSLFETDLPALIGAKQKDEFEF